MTTQVHQPRLVLPDVILEEFLYLFMFFVALVDSYKLGIEVCLMVAVELLYHDSEHIEDAFFELTLSLRLLIDTVEDRRRAVAGSLDCRAHLRCGTLSSWGALRHAAVGLVCQLWLRGVLK